MTSATVLASGGAVHPLVQDLGVCLAAAAALAVVCEKLRIPTIAAFLGAGVLIGPVGLAAINDAGSIDTIANLGLTLLLFVIGLEVNLRSLLASGRTLLVTGALQVPLTVGVAVLAFLGLRALGVALLGGTYPFLYFALACGFSSTLLVVKFLQERLLLDTVSGRLCVGLLIFQDVWAIIVLALQPSFQRPSLAPILLTFMGIAVLGTVAALAARFVLPLAFRAIAHVPELVVTTALGWCFGLGLLGAHLGDLVALVGIHKPISVSLEMGALIAGTSIASFPFAYEVVARVTHVRDFFVTLFFIGLGMSIPVPRDASVLWLALGLSTLALALRYLVFLPLLYRTGLDRRNAFDTSTRLAQVSEFCLVIAYLGLRYRHIDEAHASVVIFAFVLTALLTPLLFKLSEPMYRRAKRLLGALGFRAPAQVGPSSGQGGGDHEAGGDTLRVVILGFHRIGSALLAELERLHPDLVPATLVIDTNVELHAELRRRGLQVVYGDIASREVLRHAGLAQAEVVVSTVPDELLQNTSNAALVRTVRALSPHAVVIAHASRPSAVAEVRAAGADHVILAPAEVAGGLLTAVYAALNGSFDSFLETRAMSGGDEAPSEVLQ
ncbi:MAG: cation:proton antiporter [Deltaproteobacteria bacterium]|nr:cation:proton antiporter [Deltaproteobacteria bacterium]